MMKDKKNIILVSACVSIIVIILIIAIFLKCNSKNVVANTIPSQFVIEDVKLSDSDIKEITELLDNLKKLDEIYDTKFISDSNSFVNNYGVECYGYTGTDARQYVELYESTFTENNAFSTYQVSRSSNKERDPRLYICPVPDCNYKGIASTSFTKKEVDNNRLIIVVDDVEAQLVKNDGKWLIVSQPYTCTKESNKDKETEKNKDNDNKNIISKEEIDKEKEELSKKKEEASQKNEETPEESQSEEE